MADAEFNAGMASARRRKLHVDSKATVVALAVSVMR